jgi:hypothetical protein
MDFISVGLVQKRRLPGVLHTAFQMLIAFAMQSDQAVIDFCLQHIHFVYMQDIGALSVSHGFDWELVNVLLCLKTQTLQN